MKDHGDRCVYLSDMMTSSNENISRINLCGQFSGHRYLCALQWRHNGRDGVSNNRRLDCLLNRLFRHRSQLIKAPRHWHLWGESTEDWWIPLTKDQLRGKYFHLMTSSWWRPFNNCVTWSKYCGDFGIRNCHCAIPMQWPFYDVATLAVFPQIASFSSSWLGSSQE